MNGETFARTPYMAQLAMNEALEKLFQGRKFCGQQERKPLRFFAQEIPVAVEGDEEADTDAAYAPYIVTKVTGFNSPEGAEPMGVEMTLVVCAFDISNERQGYRDVLNICTEVVQRFRAMPAFGGACTVQGEINVAISQDDTHPYYFAAIRMDTTTHNMTMDQTLADMV